MVTSLLLLLATNAAWDATAATAPDRLGLAGHSALVVAGGADTESKQLASALGRAFRQVRLPLVLDESTVGETGGLADPQVLVKTKAAPVERWVIARAFEGDPPTAVVSVYDKSGALLLSLSARRGQPFPGGESGEVRVSDEAVKSIVSVHDEKGPALEKYAERFLWVGTGLAVSRYGASTYDVVYQGKYKRKLNRAQLYDAFGDPAIDARVADAQTTNNATWGTITLVGAGITALSAAGGVWLLVENDRISKLRNEADYLSPEYDAARERQNALFQQSLFVVGGLMTGPGLALSGGILWALSIADEPAVLAGDELRMHVEKYNARLQKELGLEGRGDLPTGLSGPPAL